jgi:hypothetical protein
MRGCSICHVGPCGLQIKLVKRPRAKIARTMLPLKSDTMGPVHLGRVTTACSLSELERSSINHMSLFYELEETRKQSSGNYNST